MMSDNQWIDEARGIAARCWCDETTKHIKMNSALAEVVAHVIASWMETATTYSKNADYWQKKMNEIETKIAADTGAKSAIKN